MSELRILEDAESVARAAAEEFVRRAQDAAGKRGEFTAALSGGSTPRALYRLLAEGGDPPYRERIPWERCWLFIGDERTVPPDHLDSNYGMIRGALLSRVLLPPDHVVHYETEGPDPELVAAQYETAVRRRLSLAPGELPRFDLVLLGMGPDGHTASLFPGTDALDAQDRIAVAVRVEKLAATRLTITLPVINHAAAVMFLVDGADKAEALRAVLEGDPAREPLPAARVRPASGEVLWLVDRAAASRLSRQA